MHERRTEVVLHQDGAHYWDVRQRASIKAIHRVVLDTSCHRQMVGPDNPDEYPLHTVQTVDFLRNMVEHA